MSKTPTSNISEDPMFKKLQQSEKETRAVQKELNQQKRDSAEKLEEQKRKHQREIKELKRQHKQELEEQERKCQQKLEEQERRHQQERAEDLTLINSLTELVMTLKKALFGTSSEKRERTDKDRNDDCESGSDNNSQAETAPTDSKTADSTDSSDSKEPEQGEDKERPKNHFIGVPRKRSNKPKRPKRSLEELMEELGIKPEIKVIKAEGDELICPACGNTMVKIGTKHVRFEISVILPRIVVTDIQAETYACPDCEKESRKKNPASDNLNLKPYTPPAPKSLLPGCQATPILVAFFMTLKGVFMNPVNRIREILTSFGKFAPSAAALCSWIIQAALFYLAPLRNAMKRFLKSCSVIQADETTIRVINESCTRKKSRSFMWQYRSGEKEKRQIAIYEYRYTRSGENAKAFLEGFTGTLVVDGFSGYNKVEGVKLAYCWVHARRYFVEAGSVVSSQETMDLIERALCSVDEIFDVEIFMRKAGYSDTERLNRRIEKSKPVVEELFIWTKSLELDKIVSKSTRKAFNYLLNHEEGLKVFLTDGAIPVTNNASERGFIRPTRGEKNWGFSYSEEGADALSLIFTAVETAKANHLDPFQYLLHIFTTGMAYSGSEIPEEVVQSWMPWNEEIIEKCRVKTVDNISLLNELEAADKAVPALA